MIEAQNESNEAPYDDRFLLWIIGIFYYILSWLKRCLHKWLYYKLNLKHKLNWYSCLEYVTNIPFNILIYINERHMQTSFKPKWKRRTRGSPKQWRSLCQSVAVYTSTIKAHQITPLNTYSSTIGIDNRASGCFPHVSTDFVAPLRDSNRIMKGCGGYDTSSIKIGTIKWTWLDDEGKSWTHYIPNSFYCESGGVRLLSPQHFAQQTGNPLGTGTTTNGHQLTLYWQQHNASLTIPLSPNDNVA